ncbi:methyltransferase domain-containing protein [Pseudomonas monteilii]|uniref:Chemotaxis protein CheR n=1 Tax=Pseudomonas putida TaxID=303 RepID=A0A7U6RBG9_PSEPU|nr:MULTISPECIES: protein-glutamate O-methyltransferase CheR [Pseudomonas]MBH3457050.1 methyltransferase domain-containing protein [Pseudomonas monteilii]MDD2122877.1 methyltransferase domain-containing protein [Pseudomonas monteilii]PXX63619.1 chemotaxis protein methyltransferase WspC [Pseudomonas sp. LAIL14HWK12:I1]SNT29470.1 chemotaxis protein methyltransferase WspC [Pseudomonas sp. LAMO17WK12:I8]SNY30025.1 chemotaxis protein methyltransferase WspC [Pseudomonas sp. LAMO17WK12:I11]
MNERFFRFLRERIGLDVESVGAPMVERALRQRCVAMNAIDLDDYWLRLQQSADEQQALIEAVIVPETWFFRYPESFTALASLAHKRLAELAGARPLRLLSLPCSTGEEPYSLAMALLDAGIAPGAFLIDGMDISPNSVAKAGKAVYGRNAFRGSDLGFRERYFDALDEGHRLHDRVQQQVSLQVGNVLDPALATRDGLYDFVFCRNLLIYFDVATQQRVFEVLKRLLHPQGVLFIGPAEGSLLARMGMRPLGIAQSFAYVRQQGSSAPQVVAPAQPARRTVLPQASVGYPPPVAPLPRPLRAVPVVARPAPAREPKREDANELLASIAQLANAGASEQARAECQRYLGQYAPSAQVYYWLGLLSDTDGDAQQALTHYRKALYLEPQHPEALVHLAALLAAQGDQAGARRLQERAARVGREPER